VVVVAEVPQLELQLVLVVLVVAVLALLMEQEHLEQPILGVVEAAVDILQLLLMAVAVVLE
jgi:hypothetical protein